MSELETKTEIEDLTAAVSDEALEALAGGRGAEFLFPRGTLLCPPGD